MVGANLNVGCSGQAAEGKAFFRFAVVEAGQRLWPFQTAWHCNTANNVLQVFSHVRPEAAL